MNHNLVIGIDIGGSHITVACIDFQTRTLIPESLIRNPVKSKGTKDEILSDWTNAIRLCKASVPNISNKIGIAMPGPFDYEKGISLIMDLDKYEALYKLNIKELLASELNIYVDDICMMNDASCFLKGEIFNGTAGEGKNVLGLTLGTGLGSALYIDGISYDGDMYCFSFKDSTAEDYLSTRWFVKEYKALTGKELGNVKDIRDQISKDPRVLTLFTEFGKNLGEVLVSYVKKHNIDVIIIGGNLINAWELFVSETEKVLSENSLEVSLLRSQLGEKAALLGAGSLCSTQVA